MLCQKHPKYQGKNKPTTKLGPADGCTCHEEFAKLEEARSTVYEVETHGGFMSGYDGKPRSVDKLKVKSLDVYDGYKKIFKEFSPGLNTILKVYRLEGSERKFMASIYAAISVRIGPQTTSMKVSSRDFRASKKEDLKPSDIHQVPKYG